MGGEGVLVMSSGGTSGLVGRRVAALLLTLSVLHSVPGAAQGQDELRFEADEELFSVEAPRVRAMLEQAAAAEIGRGQQRSRIRAAMLYCEAAAQGSGEAQYRLGQMYLNGSGLPQDEDIAATLFSMAATNGHQAAQSALELTGERREELPLCLTDPDSAWKDYGKELLVDIQAYVDALPRERRRVADIIRRLAPHFAVDTRLALAVASVESNFNAAARSPKNALGVMQLIPETALRFAVKNAMDAEQNVRGGLAYLRWLLKRFHGDSRLVVAAYNSGEGTVERYAGIPPYPETRSYVRRIMQYVAFAELTEEAKRAPQKSRKKSPANR